MDLSKTRIKEHFGIVTNDTNTKQVNFLISPPKNRSTLQKQDYIVLDHPIYGDACQVIAQVKEITSYEEVAGSTIGDRIGKMLATAEIIGFIDLRNEDKPLQKMLVPPNPGSRIYMPYTTFMEDTFARNTQGKPFAKPLHIGKAEIHALTPEGNTQQINYYLNAEDLTSTHTLIAAVNGAGKTNTATIIIQEITNKTAQPIIILDPNGEYTNLATTNYTTNTITNQTKPQETLTKTKPNQITILNGQSLTLKEKHNFFTNNLTTLAKARIEKTTQPFLLLIEDAENLKGETLEEIITPKTGITTILVTSHPTDLGGKTLAQMGNQIVGKTTDPTDIAYLRNMLNCTEEELTSLNVGEWIINGLNLTRPTKVQVKKSNSNTEK